MNTVKIFLTKNLNEIELLSYNSYLLGDSKSILWIPKVSEQRDILLLSNILCNICQQHIHIYETGLCKCNNNHIIESEIINYINSISS